MTRLILHLGDHKTGTSTLQRLFAAGHGPAHVLYPTAGRANGAGHHNLAWEVGADPRFRPGKGGWRDAFREIEANAPEIALVSTEAFEFKNPQRIMTMIAQARPACIARIDGVAYIRPHATRLLSSFAERVKRGIGPFDQGEFLDLALTGARYKFAPRISRWRKALSPGGLDIRIFHRPNLIAGDFVADFFDRVLLAHPPSKLPVPRNETPDAISLRMMQMQGAALLAAGGVSAAKSRARATQAASHSFGKGPRPQWTVAEAERIQQACGEDAQALDEMLGGNTFTAALNDAVKGAHLAPEFDPALLGIMAETAIAAARLPH